MARIFAALLCLALCSGASARNVLMIVIDDMRVDDRADTPNIDALAAQGTRYTDAYASVPVCTGSRATVLGGVSPATHGVTTTGAAKHDNFFNTPGVMTLPKAMKAAGYHTAAVGKVFHTDLTNQWDQTGPYISYTEEFNPNDPGPDGTFIDAGPQPAGVEHPDQTVATWAANYLANQEAPFFLAVGFYRPHLPWRLPEEYYDLYPGVTAHVPPADILDDEPPQAVELANKPSPFGIPQYDWIADANKADDYTRYYLAAMTHTDAMIGQVLAALDASGHAADTDVVLWSDHGYHLGEHRHWRKATFWQESVKVPLVIRAAAIPAGNVTTPVSLLDLAPTILDVAGVPPEPQFEGTSLRTGASPVSIYFGKGVATVANGQKIIDYDTTDPATAHVVQYDLTTDPGETTVIPPGC